MTARGHWQAMQACARAAWEFARRLSGDDAYERYLAHSRRIHPRDVPLSRQAFERDRLQRKWDRISRCC